MKARVQYGNLPLKHHSAKEKYLNSLDFPGEWSHHFFHLKNVAKR
jgi:hypothetical protein